MSSFSKWLAFLCLTSILASVSCPSPIVAQFAPEGVQIQGGDEAQRAAIEKAMKEQAAKQGKPGGPPKGKDDKKGGKPDEKKTASLKAARMKKKTIRGQRRSLGQRNQKSPSTHASMKPLSQTSMANTSFLSSALLGRR